MLKKNVKYTDYNGNEVSEDLYFNLTKAEIITMDSSISVDGEYKSAYATKLNDVIKSNDGMVIIQTLKDIVLKSYGVKSADGRSFIKTKIVDGVKVNLSEEFEQTIAFDLFLSELCTNADLASRFVIEVFPKDLVEEAVMTTEQPKPQSC